MKNYNRIKLREILRSSYWFVPTLMTGGAITLAFFMLTLDLTGKSGLMEKLGLKTYTGGGDSALTLLSTIASSMITVAGTVFSVTLVALTLASQQFGPRVLRNFMQDIRFQFVLGTFIGTFIYCLLVLRSVHVDGEQPFVPKISITVAILLAIASIIVLIYFIHHASTSIHAWHIIREISEELESNIDDLFSENRGNRHPEHKRQLVEKIPTGFDQQAYPILATGSGYIRAIDYDHLMNIAKSKDLLLYFKHRPGKFIIRGSELVRILPPERVNRKLTKQINHAFILGRERTAFQDVEFSIKQLVEIAIRAISPAVNDPFTAIRCIDQLSAALCRLAARDFPSPYCYDDNNNLRLVTNQVTFAGLVDDAFHQIRQYGRQDVAVTIRLLEVIATIAECTHNKKNRAPLLRHANMIRRGSHNLLEELDREDIEARYDTVIRALSSLDIN
ncbi:MAG: DUF2254 domain-containing protein [Brasilonema angustatum HA4187-MV1]|jgi:uncharacterized membrane protein|nr:DUF2254 domain-containing protein [Brasilonema angustatum HA4187-MV1]